MCWSCPVSPSAIDSGTSSAGCACSGKFCRDPRFAALSPGNFMKPVRGFYFWVSRESARRVCDFMDSTSRNPGFSVCIEKKKKTQNQTVALLLCVTEGILWDTMGYRGPRAFVWMGDLASFARCKWAQQVLLVSLPSMGIFGGFFPAVFQPVCCPSQKLPSCWSLMGILCTLLTPCSTECGVSVRF